MATWPGFASFETGGVEELFGHSGASVVSVPAPASPNETYCCGLGNGGSPDTAYMYPVTPSGTIINAFWLRFEDTGGVIGGSATIARCKDAVSGNQNWAMAYLTDGKVRFYDANNGVLGTTGEILSANTWYLFVIRWQNIASGTFKAWYVEGWGGTPATLFDLSGKDLLAEGNDGYLWFGCPFTVVSAKNMHVSGAAWGNDTAEADIPWKFEGLAYQTVHANSARDIGTNDPLDDWDESADTPAGAPHQLYFASIGQWAAKRTNGTSKSGPSGDPRLTGTILACQWVWNGYRENKWAVWGKADSTPTYTYTTESTTFAGGNYAVCQDAGHANSPGVNDHFVLGIQARALATSSVTDMWGVVLHKLWTANPWWYYQRNKMRRAC